MSSEDELKKMWQKQDLTYWDVSGRVEFNIAFVSQKNFELVNQELFVYYQEGSKTLKFYQYSRPTFHQSTSLVYIDIANVAIEYVDTHIDSDDENSFMYVRIVVNFPRSSELNRKFGGVMDAAILYDSNEGLNIYPLKYKNEVQIINLPFMYDLKLASIYYLQKTAKCYAVNAFKSAFSGKFEMPNVMTSLIFSYFD